MSESLIRVDLSDLMGIHGAINSNVFSHLSQAVAYFVEQGYEDWVEAVRKTPGIWKGDREKIEKSIDRNMTGEFSGVIWSDLKLADEVENGRPPQDLKRMLDTSTKVRVSAKGYRYLIIPFRHNVPGMSAHAPPMPTAVYVKARALAQSTVKKQGVRPSGEGYKNGRFLSDTQTKSTYLVTSSEYKWKSRLPAGLSEKLKPGHATDPYAGMVRMKTSAGRAKSSAYLTFRVMSENPSQSSKWIIPERPGLLIAKKIADKIERAAEPAFRAAIEMDYQAALNGGSGR